MKIHQLDKNSKFGYRRISWPKGNDQYIGFNGTDWRIVPSDGVTSSSIQQHQEANDWCLSDIPNKYYKRVAIVTSWDGNNFVKGDRIIQCDHWTTTNNRWIHADYSSKAITYRTPGEDCVWEDEMAEFKRAKKYYDYFKTLYENGVELEYRNINPLRNRWIKVPENSSKHLFKFPKYGYLKFRLANHPMDCPEPNTQEYLDYWERVKKSGKEVCTYYHGGEVTKVCIEIDESEPNWAERVFFTDAETSEFPCFRKHTDSKLVVMFTAPKEGEVVVRNNRYHVGHIYRHWSDHNNRDVWEPCEDPRPRRKFQVGDMISYKNNSIYTITAIECDRYRLDNNSYTLFMNEDLWELVQSTTDIKPKESENISCSSKPTTQHQHKKENKMDKLDLRLLVSMMTAMLDEEETKDATNSRYAVIVTRDDTYEGYFYADSLDEVEEIVAQPSNELKKFHVFDYQTTLAQKPRKVVSTKR